MSATLESQFGPDTAGGVANLLIESAGKFATSIVKGTELPYWVASSTVGVGIRISAINGICTEEDGKAEYYKGYQLGVHSWARVIPVLRVLGYYRDVSKNPIRLGGGVESYTTAGANTRVPDIAVTFMDTDGDVDWRAPVGQIAMMASTGPSQKISELNTRQSLAIRLTRRHLERGVRVLSGVLEDGDARRLFPLPAGKD